MSRRRAANSVMSRVPLWNTTFPLASLLEQMFASGSFFLMSMGIAYAADVETFARLSVVLGITVVSIAAVRGFSVEALLLSPSVTSRQTYRTSIALTYLAGGLAAGATTLAVEVGTGESVSEATLFAALAFALVLQDGGRYILLSEARIQECLPRTGGGCAVAVALAAGGFTGWLDEGELLGLWVILNLALVLTTLTRAIRPLTRPVALPWRYSLGFGGESLYAASVGQAAVFVMAIVATDAAVTGVRLCYSLVFGIGALVLQGLNPHVLRSLDEARRDTTAFRRITRAWIVLPVALYALSGGAYYLLDSMMSFGGNFAHAGEYLLPVGFAVIASAVFGACHLAFRYHAGQAIAHTTRIASLTVDVLLIVGLGWRWGDSGVVVALLTAGVVKLLAAGLLHTTSRRQLHSLEQGEM